MTLVHYANAQSSATRATSDLPTYPLELFAEINLPDHLGLGRWTASLGDINGDGFDDLAVSSLSDTTFIFLGGQLFDQRPDLILLGGAEGLAAGDFNGDGHRDLATATGWHGSIPDTARFGMIRIYMHNGHWPPYDDGNLRVFRGAFENVALGYNHSDIHSGVVACDMNCDSIDDLLFSSAHPENTNIREYNLLLGGSEIMTAPVHFTFTAQDLDSEWYGQQYMVGDLNDDGCGDFFIFGALIDQNSGRRKNYMESWLGNTTASFNRPNMVNTEPEWVPEGGGSNLCDVDGDGYDDILDANSTLYQGVKMFRGSGQFTQIQINDSIAIQDLVLNQLPYMISPVGDMSGDGQPEYIICWWNDIYPYGIRLFYYVYPTGPVSNWRVATGYKATKLGDFNGVYPAGDLNGDGYEEIVFTGYPRNLNPTNANSRVMIFTGSPRLTEVEEVPRIPSSYFLHVYPNPARSAAYFNFHSVGPGTATLYDMLGRNVRTIRIQGGRHSYTRQIDLEGIPPGMYLIAVQSQSSLHTTKFMITD